MGRGRPRKLPRPPKDIWIGFDMETVTLSLDQVIPLKIVPPHLKKGRHYRQIVASIRVGGIIEPPVVARHGKDRYVLLEGYLRLEALKELGKTEMTCLVSTDDEAFTHNKFVNHIAPIQVHMMILNAVKRGVPEEKIAEALDLDVNSIIRRKRLLEGICPEAAELLKDKMIAGEVFYVLKKLVAVRQIEAATLMNDGCLYTTTYAKALLAGTAKEQLVEPQKPKNVKGITAEQMARIENESSTLYREHQLVKENYGIDHMNLTILKGYLSSLLGNVKIVRYLAQNNHDFLTYFQKITEMTSLNDKGAAA